MSCLICCCACALYMFHRGRVGNVFIDSFVCLTFKEIDNKATLTFDFDSQSKNLKPHDLFNKCHQHNLVD